MYTSIESLWRRRSGSPLVSPDQFSGERSGEQSGFTLLNGRLLHLYVSIMLTSNKTTDEQMEYIMVDGVSAKYLLNAC